MSLSWRAYSRLLLWLVLPWGAVVVVMLLGRSDSGVEARGDGTLAAGMRSAVGRSGPWGRLQLTRIAIEPPADLVDWQDFGEIPLSWYFGGQTAEQVMDLFRAADLPMEIGQQLMSTMRRENDGVRVSPSPEQVLALSKEARQMIYFALARHPENLAQRWAFSMRPAFLEERFEASGLRPEIVKQVFSLLYPHGDLLLFADANVILPRLETDEERNRLLKVLSRKRAILATLHLERGMSVERIVDYWSAGTRAKDIRPLIESLARVPGGAGVDVVHLLPQFARRRLYSFPRPDLDPAAARRDCHWTSLNFYNAVPDDSYSDPAVALEHIRNNYYFIAAQPRMGDLVLLALPDGVIVHSAVYVADDFVFTKNGAVITQPWLLMPLADMLEFHSAFHPPDRPLQVLYCRKRAE